MAFDSMVMNTGASQIRQARGSATSKLADAYIAVRQRSAALHRPLEGLDTLVNPPNHSDGT